MRDRVILHADLNNCFAAIECLRRPELRALPVAVAGDPAARHGIILAKNMLAKNRGVKTAETIWQARQKCPNLVLVPPNYSLYVRFSRLFKGILLSYTDQVESFGIDEAWCDVTGSTGLFGSGPEIADAIRARVKDELGITASVGVSWNKIFAKLGSDYKKPDATTVIDRDNFKEVVWPLAADAMIFIGPKTLPKLKQRGIHTIGDVAACNPEYLRKLLGKYGEMIWRNANGFDQTPVALYDESTEVKSVGNSTTCARDLHTPEEVRLVIYRLAESVAERLRQYGLKGRVVAVSVRDRGFQRFSRQSTLVRPTDLAQTISAAALKLINDNWDWHTGIRSLGVQVTDLQSLNVPVQMEIFAVDDDAKAEALEHTVDRLRQRFGHYAVQRAVMLSDPELSGFDPAVEHTIHPVAFYKG